MDIDLDTEITQQSSSQQQRYAIQIKSSLPSVCFFTFFNTLEIVTDISISKDGRFIAIAKTDSTTESSLLSSERDKYVKHCLITGHSAPVIRYGTIRQNALLGQHKLISLFSCHTNRGLKDTRNGIGICGKGILSMSLSEDGLFVGSGCGDGTIEVFANVGGIELNENENNQINAQFKSQSNKQQQNESNSNTIDTPIYHHTQPIRILSGHLCSVEVVEFVPLNLSTDKQQQQQQSQYPHIIASGSSDKSVRIWNIETGELISIFTNHNSAITAISFVLNKEIIVKQKEKDSNQEYNSKMEKDEIDSQFDEIPRSPLIAISADDKGGIWIWDAGTGIALIGRRSTFDEGKNQIKDKQKLQSDKKQNINEQENEKEIKRNSPIWAVAASADGNLLAVGGSDSLIDIFDLHSILTKRDNKQYFDLNQYLVNSFHTRRTDVRCIQFHEIYEKRKDQDEKKEDEKKYLILAAGVYTKEDQKQQQN
ncbi:MAG: hypothetical protein EZS28_003508 [Streblomastix strix]|uniref:Uncharacterized protein n=1 Tax=Streblomastix strix TaxID=222440 RepID=A0A5J4X3B4_9EUKA|nr:MAG: hypothetical protein EZS28_003508 [Streblomastix strix]